MDSHHLLFAGLPAHPIPAIREAKWTPGVRAISAICLT
jgi:hypothetical protein